MLLAQVQGLGRLTRSDDLDRPTAGRTWSMSQSRDIAAMACTPLSGRSGRPLAAKRRNYPLVDTPKRSWRTGLPRRRARPLRWDAIDIYRLGDGMTVEEWAADDMTTILARSWGVHATVTVRTGGA